MHEDHVEAFAQRLFKRAWHNGTQEQRDKATPAGIENYIERQRKWGRDTVAIIMDKAKLFQSAGRFYPHNKDSRWLFTQVTGITLPRGSAATEKAIREYVGEEIVARVLLEKRLEELENTRQVFLREAEEERANLERIHQFIRKDKPISGGDLLFICRKLNIDVPLRTQGYMLNKLVSIASGQARHLCKRVTRSTPDMFKYYRSVVSRLNSVPVLA